MSSAEWNRDQAKGEAAIRSRLYKRDVLRIAALQQIAKACRDLRRDGYAEGSAHLRSSLEEIETQLDGCEL